MVPLSGSAMRKSAHNKQRGLTLIEVMIVVAIIGLLVATALPSYIKWVRRTHSAEATMNLRKLYDSSVVYFAATYSDSAGAMLQNRFPETTGMKPNPVPNGRSTTTDDWLDDPTWHALHFNISDPHRFAYQYDSGGAENTATFTASAFADLDFDGQTSTFVRFGTVHQMEVRGSGGLYSVNELE